MAISSPSVVHNIYLFTHLQQINLDNHHDESKTRTHRFSKLSDVEIPGRQITFIYLYGLLKNHQGGHIYQQTENLHTVCVQAAERRRRLQRPIRLASRRVTQCCSWKYEHR